jgi:hypothetical protein
MWYAAGSWRKLKSFDGMSSMPRDVPSWGDNARDGRAGERTRVGRVDGVRVAVDAERGLCLGVSKTSHACATCIIVHRIRICTYSSTSASRGPRVNCLVRGATALFSQHSIRESDDGGHYLAGGHRHLRVRVHDSVLFRYFVVELASFAGSSVLRCLTHVIACFRPKSGFPTVTIPHAARRRPLHRPGRSRTVTVC